MPTVLCADDFALSRGVSDGILDLVADGRLSATGAMVTTADWPRAADALAGLRDRVAVGLHLDLTFGRPLGPMPRLAPGGAFPNVATLIRLALANRLDPAETAAEVGRQLDRFAACFGHAPDFVDGHEHVHILPGIRASLLRAVASRFDRGRLLVRDPSDRVASIVGRGVSVGKAMLVRTLATGFGRAAARAGALRNGSFAGFTSFADREEFPEFDRFLLHPRACHLIMCHPGRLDGGAASPHAARRHEEYVALRRRPGLADLVWHPDRAGAARAGTSIFAGIAQSPAA